MSNEKVVCTSCGASFDKDEPKCPYCGTLNPYGAEKEYNEKLENIRGKLDVVDDIAKASYIEPLKKGVQAFLIVFAISMAIFAIGVTKQISHGKGNQKKRRDDVDKKIDRIISFKGNEKELNTLFEEKKYDEIADIFDTMEQSERSEVYNWEHYQFINFYFNLKYSRDYIGYYLTDGQQYYYNLAEAIYYAQTYYINCFVGYFSDSFTQDETTELQRLWDEHVTYLLSSLDIPESDFYDLLDKAIAEKRAQYQDCNDYAKTRLGVE